MKHKPVVVFIILVLAAASSEVATAQTWIPGVAAGDYFNYTMYGVYVTNQSSLNIPQFEYNNTDWTRINVTGVEGSVTYQVYTLHYKNGSETSFNFKCNVDPENKSGLKFNEKGVPLCAANLTVGDTMPTDETVIDETVNRTYASGSRETNHAFWNSSTDWGDIYFDRETGMLVELHRTHRFGDGAEAVDKTDVIVLTGTNRWQVSPETHQFYTPLLIALTIGILSLLILVVIMHRAIRAKSPNRQLGK
jgi:hypothetical protein